MTPTYIGNKTFSTQASDLGWKAGEWPQMATINNVRCCRMYARCDAEGDLLFYEYRTAKGYALIVYND